MKILSGHYGVENALLVEDYPYGFKLRCKIRYWLEVNDKGTRFWSQTTNPKANCIGYQWNKPKASTYSLVGSMFMVDESDGKPEEIGHIHWSGLSPYDVSKCREYLETYRLGLTDRQITLIEKLATGYESLQARKAVPIG
jgi:hypothetical protein